MNTERKRGGRIPKLNPKSHHVMVRFTKGAFLAVNLHPKGKAMDGASISFRDEQDLMFRKGQDFPNSFHSDWRQLLTKTNTNPPKQIFYVLKNCP